MPFEGDVIVRVPTRDTRPYIHTSYIHVYPCMHLCMHTYMHPDEPRQDIKSDLLFCARPIASLCRSRLRLTVSSVQIPEKTQPEPARAGAQPEPASPQMRCGRTCWTHVLTRAKTALTSNRPAPIAREPRSQNLRAFAWFC